MTLMFPLITFSVALLVVLAVRAAQLAQDRRRQRNENKKSEQQRGAGADRQREARERTEHETRDMRDRSNPSRVVWLEGVAMGVELGPLRHQLQLAQRELATVRTVLAALPKQAYTGLQAHLRQAAMVVLPATAAAGMALAIAVMVALNDGHWGVAPVLKGLVAGSLEMLVAFVVTRLFHDRRPRELHWLTQIAASVALLIVIVGYLAVYSPQRSRQQYAAMVDDDQRVLTQAEHAVPAQPLAVGAAKSKLSTDRTRMKRAEGSDTAFAILIPLVEVLTAEMAFEGLGELLLSRRRREAEARVRSAQTAIDDLTGEIDLVTRTRTMRTATRLDGLGVDAQRYMNNNRQHGQPVRDTPGPTGPPGSVDPTPPPTSPTPSPAGPTEPPVTGGAAEIDLNAFAPVPAPEPGAGPEWDLA